MKLQTFLWTRWLLLCCFLIPVFSAGVNTVCDNSSSICVEKSPDNKIKKVFFFRKGKLSKLLKEKRQTFHRAAFIIDHFNILELGKLHRAHHTVRTLAKKKSLSKQDIAKEYNDQFQHFNISKLNAAYDAERQQKRNKHFSLRSWLKKEMEIIKIKRDKYNRWWKLSKQLDWPSYNGTDESPAMIDEWIPVFNLVDAIWWVEKTGVYTAYVLYVIVVFATLDLIEPLTKLFGVHQGDMEYLVRGFSLA